MVAVRLRAVQEEVLALAAEPQEVVGVVGEEIIEGHRQPHQGNQMYGKHGGAGALVAGGAPRPQDSGVYRAVASVARRELLLTTLPYFKAITAYSSANSSGAGAGTGVTAGAAARVVYSESVDWQLQHLYSPDSGRAPTGRAWRGSGSDSGSGSSGRGGSGSNNVGLYAAGPAGNGDEAAGMEVAAAEDGDVVEDLGDAIDEF
jgi:hypothetical protein